MIDPHWERGLRADTPAWAREELACLLRKFPNATHADLLRRKNWPGFQDLQRFFTDNPLPEHPEFTRSPLWKSTTVPFQTDPLPRFTFSTPTRYPGEASRPRVGASEPRRDAQCDWRP